MQKKMFTLILIKMELNVFRNMFFCLKIGLYVLKKKYKKKCNNKRKR